MNFKHSKFAMTATALSLSLALTGCLTDDDDGGNGGGNGDPVTTQTVTVGAQDNAQHGSSVDLDGFNVYTVTAAKARSQDIDLIFANSTATVGGSVAIYSPDAAKNGIGGSAGFDFMQSGWTTANNTTMKVVTGVTIANINNTDQIDSLWAAGTAVNDGRLYVTNGTTFVAESDKGLKVLVRVTDVDQGDDGSASLSGIAKF